MEMKRLFKPLCIVFFLLFVFFYGAYRLRPGNYEIIVGPKKAVTDTIYMKFPELDSIWKPTYRYAIILPSDSTMSFYFRLVEFLTVEGDYTKDNTFLICREEDLEIVEKYLPGYSTFFKVYMSGRRNIFYTVKKIDDNWCLLEGEEKDILLKPGQ